ncbi:NUDIX domain-containing protein [Paenibacillus apiarius]|uniref:NUDIX domain-containing protein n=1 Tax=Paenibacillus apiarius TaxID=46240 RepID=A0ABT4DMI7_9BACL|nr:NUDIX domain-containing protein [Paenibacillus apiarius]MCY9514584.1 NUDIX domain-containing protein [Paenibacillus apiarius]MCY9518574.1 NUDIX domain-containing protein [Paenibacillus apiarius]MCY9552662.1 NUDIX domain-containing protein [Paenibacillus apiarius]MCY9557010.1 NUDIX domain-containing protein [Paenibacillus apiarius]MCY9686037.1 NUDIX domain-containing protein [Paenibacillus apiarius]
MRIREMATAFLFHQDRILMMKKPESRICPTEFWSGVGGHLEPGELNHPLKACLREIEEETGLQAKELRDIRLRYILLRQTETEIRQQYVYFASADHPNVVSSAEGDVYWIYPQALSQLRMSAIIAKMLEHYALHTAEPDIYVGTMSVTPVGKPIVQWSVLKDPGLF